MSSSKQQLRDRHDSDTVVAAQGGSFVTEDRLPTEVMTPEDLTEEQRFIRHISEQWIRRDVVPRLPEILEMRHETIRELMRKGGDLDLLGVEIPEAYGGLGLGKVTSAVVMEEVGRDGSFATTFAAHTGIGTLPILYFGTEEQKRKFLPRFATGEWIAAYSLSEASSASDALNAKTRAVLSSDGTNWILNGEKMWLANAGFADVYTMFAKVDGEHFTAFIIERGMPGVTLGLEERKTGLKESSSRPLVLSDAVIPRDNVLGEIGKGHKIALNILNLGRWKLGAAVTGGTKNSLREVIQYAKSRLAFGRPISEFGTIRDKIGEMVLRTYVGESMVYRVGGLVDRRLATVDQLDAVASLKAIEEYDVESSIVKVWCSEMLAYVVDEAVQIHGGAGFVEDYSAERQWRDARVYRTYEGTDEINRLLVPGRLLRRALKGESPLFAKMAMIATEDLAADRDLHQETNGALADVAGLLTGAKKIALTYLNRAVHRFGPGIAEQPEILSDFGDMIIDVFALESALLRTQKTISASNKEQTRLREAAVRCFAAEAMDRVENRARRLLGAMEELEPEQNERMRRIQRLARQGVFDTLALRRLLSAAAIESGGYPFE